MYEDLLQIYVKVNTTTSIPIPKLVFAEACLKISRFLMIIFLNGGWNDTLLTKIVQSSPSESILKREGRFMSVSDLIKCKGSGLTRFSIAKWITKIWIMDVDDMPMIDQVRSIDGETGTWQLNHDFIDQCHDANVIRLVHDWLSSQVSVVHV